MISRETSSEIDDHAAQWAARVDRSPLSSEEQRNLEIWLAGDSRRVGAYAMARAALVRVDAARALGADYDPEQFIAGAAQNDNGAGWLSRRRLLGMSASVLAVAGAGLVGMNLLGGRRYSTTTGGMLRVSLEDGSIVNLNTESTLEVRFDGQQRTVFLRAGEALFEVARDRARPFVVMAGETGVRAVGTSFTVRREADKRVAVVVSEGEVEVTQRGIDVPAVRLTENMMAQADPEAVVPIETSTIDQGAVARRLFWREGKIGFSDTTLGEASAEFARYSDIRIVIPETQVAEQRVTGLFTATDPAGFADAAAASLGLKVQHSGNIIRILAQTSAMHPRDL
ncbi:FecR family protein [Rhizorhabdus sp. FW153]|uniref:FecR family protein n=1 Tax=Rhizorhabdus sp. FW153 TaxID=3400216 RepID=UPI003CF82DDE